MLQTEQKFRLRGEFTAVQWFKMGDHPDVVLAWRNGHGGIDLKPIPACGQEEIFAYRVATPKGYSHSHAYAIGEVTPSDWIVTEADGSVKIVADSVFHRSYEPILIVDPISEVRMPTIEELVVLAVLRDGSQEVATIMPKPPEVSFEDLTLVSWLSTQLYKECYRGHITAEQWHEFATFCFFFGKRCIEFTKTSSEG